jgi:hypothetical protein
MPFALAITCANDWPAEPLDPLTLGPDWDDPLPLISLDQALERSLLVTGLTREQLISRLLADVGHPLLHPLLWVLPRRWRLTPAALPSRLQGLSALLQQGLISPLFLAALVDDLAHLWPPVDAAPTAVTLWQRQSIDWQGATLPLPSQWAALQGMASGVADSASTLPPAVGAAKAPRWQHITQGLRWTNVGLGFSQTGRARCANALLAQVFNRLAANVITPQTYSFEGCNDGASLLAWLSDQGWSVGARLRSSIASFGFGAALVLPDEQPRQIPLALPLRTGLLDRDDQEVVSLLPHTALELELSRGDELLRLQWYQGTGGLCGWDGLNDLRRPWQNDPQTGTVRYLGDPFEGEQLPALMPLCELIALVHNLEASESHLRLGGYGSLGFCIDSTALLQQALSGCCDLFPLVLPGLWRERLLRRCSALVEDGVVTTAALPVLEAYRRALVDLPLDFSHHGSTVNDAWRRLRASLPLRSPFAVIQRVHQLQPGLG